MKGFWWFRRRVSSTVDAEKDGVSEAETVVDSTVASADILGAEGTRADLSEQMSEKDSPASADGVHDQAGQQSLDDNVQSLAAEAEHSAPAEAKGQKRASLRPLDIAVPETIGRYTLARRIGSGTCGVVHLALDNLLCREVAVKLSPVGEAHVSTGKVPGAQRAYQTEIIAAGKLAHPNIVTVYDAGQYEALNYLVMEVVEGKSLKAYGKGKKLLPVGEALRIIVACCRALDYSHEQGILHRDIKPANIMLSTDGSVKLLDFGIAVGLNEASELKKRGPTLGTPNYMSPEQIMGRDLGPPSDFYSLATVLFELLTGRQLFKAKKVKELFRTVVHQEAPRLDAVRADMPKGLADVLARALSKKPHLRFQSGADMAAALEPWLQSFRVIESRPMVQQRLIKILLRQHFFEDFSELEIALLLDRVRIHLYSPGETLIEAQAEDRQLMVVIEGTVSSTVHGQFNHLIMAGHCLGETGFISGQESFYTYHALTDVKVLEFTPEELGTLPPHMHLNYYRRISEVMLTRQEQQPMPQIDIRL